MSEHGHPIEVDLERILPILASEIYTTQFAFLRENVQNAFDAIRIQQYRDLSSSVTRDHRVLITLQGNTLFISDTGIGMSIDDLKNLFWSIGKSGKHTAEAKSAGVVGTFGIGGMANFGVCSRLEVTTRTHQATRSVSCWAERDKLSAKDECVFYSDGPEDFEAGTTVKGTLIQSITEGEIAQYLEPIVQYLDVPIYLSDKLLSRKPFPKVPRTDGASLSTSYGPASFTLYVRALQNGQAQIEVDSLAWNNEELSIRAVFSTTSGVVCAFHRGFMLANIPVSTIFGLGGNVDCPLLRPTAGREAVTDESRTLVQHILGAVEIALAEHIARAPNLVEHFSAFYRYLRQHNRGDLAELATIRVYGSTQRVTLKSIRDSASDQQVFFAREGHDQAIMQAYGEQGKKVAILSNDAHRQVVERKFLTQYCKALPLEDRVTCLRLVDNLTLPELALKYRLHNKITRQFLIENLVLRSGELSHRAMLLAPPKQSSSQLVLFIDFSHEHIKRLVNLRDSLSFDAVCDIFIRDYILPHLETVFPELRKRDFDALLRKLQSSVEFFEIDPNDIRRIQQLAEVTNMSPETVAAILGARRHGGPVPTAVRRADVAKMSEVVQPSPGRSIEEMKDEVYVKLLEIETDAKILDASDSVSDLGLCRFYLAMTKDAHVLYRRIFLERNPSTDFSWGGHRAGYLFYSEGTSVVYYDIQFTALVQNDDDDVRSGTISLDHRPLVLKNMVFLPIPHGFERFLVPEEGILRFSVQHQIMGIRELDTLSY